MGLIGCLMMFFGSVGQIQAKDYNQSRLDYQTQYSKYREILLEYRSARSEYLTYKTLVAQTRAVYVTQQFLTARQGVIMNYLQMLQARMGEAGTYLDQELVKMIDNQIQGQLEFHQSQPVAIEAAATLEDLVKISSKIDNNIATVNAIGLQTQALVLDSRMQEYQANTGNLMGFATEQIRRIAKEGQKDTTDVDRWLLEAEQKYNLAMQGLSQTKEKIDGIKSDKQYEAYRTDLKKAAQYLKETNKLLNEIVVNLKIE